jgi:hypothetical protein
MEGKKREKALTLVTALREARQGERPQGEGDVNPECFFFKKQGHFKQECPQRKKQPT